MLALLSVFGHTPLLDDLSWPSTAQAAYGLLFLLAAVGWVVVNGTASLVVKIGSWVNPLLGVALLALLAVVVNAG